MRSLTHRHLMFGFKEKNDNSRFRHAEFEAIMRQPKSNKKQIVGDITPKHRRGVIARNWIMESFM